MSPLENMLQERQTLENKGYSEDQIQSAALMLIAERLIILSTPIITMKEAQSADD